MPLNRNLLTRGNGKLGEGVYAWSLPALDTCPGRTDLCSRVCYARSGRFKTRAMQTRLAENLALSQADDFVARITAEVHRRGVQTLRIHVSGDFYDHLYVNKWTAIARRCPRTIFYGYTRSWRLPTIVPALVALADRPNLRLWFSCDAETGFPLNLPPGVRVAYLQTDRQEEVTGDLIFRIRPLRKLASPHPTVPIVCPSEVTGRRPTNVTCTSCRLCHR